MSEPSPRLLVAAHGTVSAAGRSTIEALRSAVAAARPAVQVDLCFLDVADPRLPDALDERPTVVVPALLTTGYHVLTDIPAAVAPHPATILARHLGPHPLLIDALVDRLGDADAASTVLVCAGSSRAEAVAEIDAAAALLAARVGNPVTVATMGDDLPAVLAAIDQPFRVATYLLCEGHFVDTLTAAVAGRGVASAPLGAHQAVVELIWLRYDEALGVVR